MPLRNRLRVGAGKMRVFAMVAASGLLACVGCAGATKTSPRLVVPYTNGNVTVTVGTRISTPSKQEIGKAQGCLKRDRVRPARHTHNRYEVPHGANEVTRNGLPMTSQEYEATVRRCLARTVSASASAHRN
jgi:hypothetical protein